MLYIQCPYTPLFMGNLYFFVTTYYTFNNKELITILKIVIIYNQFYEGYQSLSR